MIRVLQVVILSLVLGPPGAPCAAPHDDSPLESAGSRSQSKRKVGKVTRGDITRAVEDFFRKTLSGGAASAIETHFRLVSLTPAERGEIGGIGLYLDEDLVALRDESLAARILATRWEYEYQPAALALGTRPLDSEFAQAFYSAQEVVEAERARILSSRGISEDQFQSLLAFEGAIDVRSTVQALEKLESINAELWSMIQSKRDREVLERNIPKMTADLEIRTDHSGGVAFWTVSVKPFFQVTFVERAGVAKILYLEDSL